MIRELVEKKEKKVEYIELIYDLIFVYIIGRNNSLLHHTVDGFIPRETLVIYTLCTLAVLQIWMLAAYFINTYGEQRLRDHIFLFVNMFLLYFIAEGTRAHWQSYHVQYHVAWALLLLNIFIQYKIELRRQMEDRRHRRRIKRILLILVVEAAMVIGAIFEYRYLKSSFLSAAAILGGIAAFSFNGITRYVNVADFMHLSERAMLYVVFTFGEMIVAIAVYFEGKPTWNSLYFAAMAFLIAVGLFLSYGAVYDHILDRELATNGIGYMLIHILLIFSLNNITTALEFMRNDDVRLLPKALMMTGSCFFYYAGLFATGRYAKKRGLLNKRFYVAVGLISLAFVGVLIWLRAQMYVNIAITVVWIFTVFFVIHHIGKRMEE